MVNYSNRVHLEVHTRTLLFAGVVIGSTDYTYIAKMSRGVRQAFPTIVARVLVGMTGDTQRQDTEGCQA